MSWEAVAALTELLALAGVIGSLIFVGVEVRQNSADTRASANATVADAFRELNLAIASSPQIVRALAESGAKGQDALAVDDKIVLLAFYRALFHTWSNAHRQHANGTLDIVIFQAVVQEISAYSEESTREGSRDRLEERGSSVRWAWERERYIFNSDFQEFVDDLIGLRD